MKKNFLSGLLTGIAGAFIVVAIATALLVSGNQISLFNLSGGSNGSVQDSNGTENEKEVLKETINNKVDLLEEYINKFYLEDVDDTVFADGIYKGVLNSLEDPYSVYYTKKEYDSMMETSSGTYTGIGATVSQDVKTGVITIVKPFVNGPAYEAGLLPGDVIYKIEGEEVTGVDLSEVVSRMKGQENTEVKVTTVREGVSEPIEVTITRRKIEVPTIEYAMMNDNVGYIKITEFDEITASQFRKALADLETKGLQSLVVDLRDNPGGRLDTVVDILDRMLPEGMIVYTKDKYGEGDEYKSTSKEQFDKPLAVLMNGNSASASEVFAGAIQDYGIGTLVGTTSFGKGIVQSIIKLDDGTAIKLTVSKYYTPKGRNIHGTGIEPDVTVELDDSLKQKVEITKEEDNQLQKAVSVLKEKTQ